MIKEEIINRKMPCSIEAEYLVIGSMMIDPEAIATVSRIIKGKDFYIYHHGLLFDAIVKLFGSGKPVDWIAVLEMLESRAVQDRDFKCLLDMFKKIPLNYLRDVADKTPDISDVERYAESIRQKSMLRDIISSCTKTIEDCYGNSADVESIVSEVENSLLRIVCEEDRCDSVTDSVMSVLSCVEKAGFQNGSVITLPSGFDSLDRLISGFQKSELVLVAARPSMGKTAFMLGVAQDIALRQKKPVAIFSLEMNEKNLINRLIPMESDVDAQQIRDGKLSDYEWERVIEAGSKISNSSLIIDDTPGIALKDLVTKCRRYKAAYDVQIIFIDYLQLMEASNQETDKTRFDEMSEISRTLKLMARELNIPVVVLSQLSRSVEQRTDKRPRLSDFRESGAIEQDADKVLFIYRDDYYNSESEMNGLAEIIVAKQRNGVTGMVNLRWLREYVKFS